MTATGPELRTTYFVNEHSTIWPVWPNGWVFFYELSGSGFEFSCRKLNFRFCACFEQGVPWHSANIECEFTLKRVRGMTRTYSQLNCSNFKLKLCVKGFGIAPIVKESTFEGVWNKLEAKICFQRQPFTRYLRLTLVLMCSNVLREKLKKFWDFPNIS